MHPFVSLYAGLGHKRSLAIGKNGQKRTVSRGRRPSLRLEGIYEIRGDSDLCSGWTRREPSYARLELEAAKPAEQ